MTLQHPVLMASLQKAYSAEKAAAFAYVGHAGSLKNAEEKTTVQQIEHEEWDHRRHVLKIMQQYNIPVSKFHEIKYYLVGKIIGFSCYFIGRFMPYFFAGKLESGNVCEYFAMIHHFHSLGITEHDEILYEMGIAEKKHEVYFLGLVQNAKWFPLFEKIFAWGSSKSLNDVDLENQYPVEMADQYCTDRQPEHKKTAPSHTEKSNP